MRGEQLRVVIGQQRQCVAAKPPDDVVLGDRQPDRRGGRQRGQIRIVVVTQRGVDPVQARVLEQRVPDILAVVASHDRLQQVEHHALHRSPMLRVG